MDVSERGSRQLQWSKLPPRNFMVNISYPLGSTNIAGWIFLPLSIGNTFYIHLHSGLLFEPAMLVDPRVYILQVWGWCAANWVFEIWDTLPKKITYGTWSHGCFPCFRRFGVPESPFQTVPSQIFRLNHLFRRVTCHVLQQTSSTPITRAFYANTINPSNIVVISNHWSSFIKTVSFFCPNVVHLSSIN